MLASRLCCCYQEDRVTSPRSEEGCDRARPGLWLWQALSKVCECCPSEFASLGRASWLWSVCRPCSTTAAAGPAVPVHGGTAPVVHSVGSSAGVVLLACSWL